VSSHSPPIEDLDPIEAVPADEIEELGDEAIIAQQSQAHLPQKRTNVQAELPSIVIAENAPPTSSRRPPAYQAETREATVVMRDRREAEAPRHKVLEQKPKPQAGPGGRGMGPYVWAGLAIAAFAAGGLVTLLLVRGASARQSLSETAVRGVQDERVRAPAAPRLPPAEREPVTPQVKLEELPLEQPAR
jgi:hypothetical protein